MKSIANNRIARAMSMLLVFMFMFTLLPASLVMATESDYTMTLTSDVTSAKAGDTINLTVTVDGALANVSLIQYSIAFDDTIATTSTTGKSPACFDSSWYTDMKNEEEGLGYISKPSVGIANGALNVLIVSNSGYYIDSESDLYDANTVVAGKIVFTAATDIADVSKVFTLTNAKMAQLINGAQVEKTVKAVQLESAVEGDADADADSDADADADYDYTMTLTSDVTSAKAGDTINLTVTVDGALANVSLIQYSIAFDDTIATTSTTGKSPACFDSSWYTDMKNEEEGLGYISKPSVGIANGALNVLIVSNSGYYIDSESDLYDANTVVAGKIVFTAATDIADVSKVFTLTNAKMAQLINGAQVEKTVKAVQLVGSTEGDADADADQEAADAVIALIDAIGTVTLDSEAAIIAAEKACADLTETQLALVTNYAVLEAARAKYDELKAADDKAKADQAAADAVIALINAIGTVDANSLDAIEVAEEAYEKLTADQKTLVTNYADLTEARAAYDALGSEGDADADYDYIMTLTSDVTSAKAGDTINLTVTVDGALANVSLIQYSIAFDDTIATTSTTGKSPACFDSSWYTDMKNEEEGLGYISKPSVGIANGALNVLIVSNSGYYIDSESDLYDANTVVAGKIVFTAATDIADVSKVFTLTNAKMAQLINGAQVEKTVKAVQLVGSTEGDADADADADSDADADADSDADKEAAANVDALIDAIGTVTLDSLNAIETAEEAYDLLTDAQRELVTKYDTLKAAREDYDYLKEKDDKEKADQAAADAVIKLINELGEITLDSKDAIDAAFKAYNGLTYDQMILVTNYADLKEAKATYDALVTEAENKAAADNVIKLINNIGEVTLNSKAAIDAAETAYNALTDEQKELVDNYETLTAAKQTYEDLLADADKEAADQAAAEGVDTLINAIGEVTLESEAAIKAAEDAYAALTDDQKVLVKEYNTLTKARETYDALKEAADKEAADKEAADAVIKLINEIGEVTLDSIDAIEAAEEAYAELTEDQKALVTNYADLTAAREDYDALKAEADKPVVDVTDEPIYDDVKIVVITNVPANKIVTIGEITAVAVTAEDGTVKYIAAVTDDIDEDDIVVADGTPAELLMGDADLNGTVTATDALIILKKAAEVTEVATYYANPLAYVVSDINGSAKITAGDALITNGVAGGDEKAIAKVKSVIDALAE